MENKNGGIFFDVILALTLSFNASFTIHIMLRISMAFKETIVPPDLQLRDKEYKCQFLILKDQLVTRSPHLMTSFDTVIRESRLQCGHNRSGQFTYLS